jgi:hypothetical protein
LGETIPAPPDYRVLRAQSYSYRTDMGFEMGTSTGPRVSVSGNYDRTNFAPGAAAQPDFELSSARTEVSQRAQRKIRLSGGYEYRTSTFGLGATSDEHRFEFGAEYSPTGSTDRRSSLRVRIAPSIFEADTLRVNDQIAGPVFRTQGQASVDYYFRRTWRAFGQVERGFEYVPGLAAPVFADTGRFGLQGLLTRRVDLLATTGYATGTSVVNAGHELETYTGSVRLRFAVSRNVALYTEYLHFYYDLRGQLNLAPDLPRSYQQRSVKIGLTLWASVF